MFNTYIRSILSGHGFVPMLDAEKGGGGGGADDKGADDKGGAGADDSGSGAGGQKLSLDELMKDPDFKAQYQAKFEDGLNTRMKKYKDIDPEEYKRLKDAEEEKANAELSDAQKLQKKLDALEAEKQTFEAKERLIAVKEYAIAEGLNPKIAKLVDNSSIKRAEDGETFEGIAEAVEAVKADFPELFPAEEDDNGGGDDQSQKNNQRRTNFPHQKGNPPSGKKGYAAGAAIAAARHGKKD